VKRIPAGCLPHIQPEYFRTESQSGEKARIQELYQASRHADDRPDPEAGRERISETS